MITYFLFYLLFLGFCKGNSKNNIFLFLLYPLQNFKNKKQNKNKVTIL